jgi:uncharacterized protein (TIGR02246 family)
MKRVLRIAILAVATVGLAQAYTFGERPQGLGSREDEDAIKRVLMDMTAAFNRHEPDTSLFTRDADFVNVQGTWLKGAAEIERGRKARFETALKEAQIKLLDTRIRFVTPDVAIAHFMDEISGMAGSDGTKIPAQRELSLRVLIKTNGTWLVTAFHNTPVGPSVAARPR